MTLRPTHWIAGGREQEAPVIDAIQSESAILGAGSGTAVTVDFVDADPGAEIVVVHEGFTSEAIRDAFIAGWARCLRRMEPAPTPR